MPQCLVIAPSYADLSSLRVVLDELGTAVTTTAQLQVGVQLAAVPLDGFDFAVAVLPATGVGGQSAATPSVVFLEAGIVLGRGLPLIVLAESPDADFPGVGNLARDVWTVAGAKDEASIRLHLSLFSKSLESRSLSGNGEPRMASPPIAPDDPSPESGALRAYRLEDIVLTLLHTAGALVEEPGGGARDAGVDAAVLVPGAERALGPVLVEAKALHGRGLSAFTRQLAAVVTERGASLGLLVYDGEYQQPQDLSKVPVLAMHVNDLRQQVGSGALGRTLIDARNSFVHG